MELTNTEMRMDLDFFLSREELDFFPFTASRCSGYSGDFLRACKAGEGSAVFVGKKDTYFPEPVFLTEEEMEDYIDSWVVEQERTMNEDDENWQSRDEISSAVYDAAVEIPERIVKKALARIKKCI